MNAAINENRLVDSLLISLRDEEDGGIWLGTAVVRLDLLRRAVAMTRGFQWPSGDAFEPNLDCAEMAGFWATTFSLDGDELAESSARRYGLALKASATSVRETVLEVSLCGDAFSADHFIEVASTLPADALLLRAEALAAQRTPQQMARTSYAHHSQWCGNDSLGGLMGLLRTPERGESLEALCLAATARLLKRIEGGQDPMGQIREGNPTLAAHIEAGEKALRDIVMQQSGLLDALPARADRGEVGLGL